MMFGGFGFNEPPTIGVGKEDGNVNKKSNNRRSECNHRC